MGRQRHPVAGRIREQMMVVLGMSAGDRSNIFLNSTHKHIKLSLTGYLRLYSEC